MQITFESDAHEVLVHCHPETNGDCQELVEVVQFLLLFLSFLSDQRGLQQFEMLLPMHFVIVCLLPKKKPLNSAACLMSSMAITKMNSTPRLERL